MLRSDNVSPQVVQPARGQKMPQRQQDRGMNKKVIRNLAALAGPYMRKRVEAGRNDVGLDYAHQFEVLDSCPAEAGAALQFILTNQHKNLIREQTRQYEQRRQDR